MFAVIYRAYLKPGRESEYREAWNIVASHFVEHRGALGSCLHRADSGLWVAYSRWPSKEMRDASWPQGDPHSVQLPDEILQAVIVLKDCMETQLPEITMEVVDDLLLPQALNASALGC